LVVTRGVWTCRKDTKRRNGPCLFLKINIHRVTFCDIHRVTLFDVHRVTFFDVHRLTF
jgi:hypothetical protein